MSLTSTWVLGVLVFSATLLRISECAQTCAAGWGHNAAGICKPCAPGFYSATVQGVRQCLECPVSFYSDKPKAKACKQCPLGLWTGFKGQKSKDSCYPCYATDPIPQVPQPDGQGGLTCQRCPKGSYAKNGATCVKCSGRGRFVVNYNTCAKCPAGTMHNGKTSVLRRAEACTPCGFNTYQDIAGQSRCKPCPAGTVVLQAGSRSAAACVKYLAGKKVAFKETISSSIKEDLFTPRRSSYVELKSSKAVQRTIVSGARVSCDRAAIKRLVGNDGVKPQAAGVEARRTQCVYYTLYLLPGSKYRLAATFRVPFKANKDQAFYGQLSSKLSFRLRFQEAKKGVREYLLTEDVKWTGLTQV